MRKMGISGDSWSLTSELRWYQIDDDDDDDVGIMKRIYQISGIVPFATSGFDQETCVQFVRLLKPINSCSTHPNSGYTLFRV